MLATGRCLWCYKSVFGETKDILLQMFDANHSHCTIGLCMHKEVIFVDICNSSFKYIKIFFFLCKRVIGVTFQSLEYQRCPMCNKPILIIFVQIQRIELENFVSFLYCFLIYLSFPENHVEEIAINFCGNNVRS